MKSDDDYWALEKEVSQTIRDGAPELIELMSNTIKDAMKGKDMSSKVLDAATLAQNVLADDKSTKLSDKNIDDIVAAMEENLEESENLSYIADMPSNNGSNERDPEDITEQGFVSTVNMAINPEDGTAIPTNEDTTTSSLDMTFEDLMNAPHEEKETIIDENDLIGQIKESDILEDETGISRDDTIELLRIVQRVQNKEEFNVYKALPESIRNQISGYITKMGGPTGFSPDANRMRNDIAKSMIDEFITNISLNHIQEEYTKDMQELQEEINDTLCDILVEYKESQDKYINSLLEKADTEEKKERVQELIDTIADGLYLERVKQAAREHKIKIKKFDLEKPSREFNSFLNKYSKPTPSIYSIYDATNVLYRHTKKDFEYNEVLSYMLAVCKFCKNYKAEVPLEHVFMYYFVYNIMCLDVYKGDKYTKYIETYEKSMRELIDLLAYAK